MADFRSAGKKLVYLQWLFFILVSCEIIFSSW